MRILTRPNLGGPTRQAIALWHAHRALGVSTLLVTGAVGDDESPLSPAAEGVPALTLEEVLARGPAVAGWLEVPALGRAFSPFADARARALLRRVLRAFQPEVVHTHTSKAGWLGRSAARAAGVPVIAHTFHGHVLADYFGPLVSRLLTRLEARLARGTHLLFAVSGSCAAELAAAGVAPRERFVVLPPAVAIPPMQSRADARRRLGIPSGQYRIVCAGRLVPIKRVDHFVAMVAGCSRVHGDVVGDGPLRGELATRIAALAPDRLVLRGALPDLAALLPAYDALVLPSVREGCPLVAVEAFAAGVPVAGYDVPGVSDVLGGWGSGLLVPPALGPAGLAAAVARLHDEAGVAAACIAAGRTAVARFAPAAVAAELLAAYRTALAAPVRTPRGARSPT